LFFGKIMRGKKNLTETDFETIKPYLTRLKECNVAAIHKILVSNVPQKLVAAELGVTAKAVSQMVGKAWQLYVAHGGAPEGLVRVDVWLTPDVAEMVIDMAHKARKKVK